MHLSGEARLSVGAATADSGLPVAEANDTLDAAVDTGVVAGGREGYRGAGVIGDNAAVRPLARKSICSAWNWRPAK